MTSLTKVFALLLTLFLFFSLQTASAEDRWFQIEEVNIHALIDTDGSMHVTETDTYHFNGTFNGILIDLDTSGSDGIEDFQAYEVAEQEYIPLEYEETSDGNRIQYRIYSASEDETKVFEFTYSLLNVVQVYADTAELYWKFFDESNENTLETVQIDVEFPEGAKQEEIKAFGHGPLEGTVERPDARTVQFQVSPLPAYKMFETRLLFPDSYVPDSTKINSEPMLEQILEEEENWSYSDDDEFWTIALIIFIALLLLHLLVGALFYYKFGKPYKPDWKHKYYRELPEDVSPAVVSYLMKRRNDTSDLIATLLDLVRKKYVSMQVVKSPDPKEQDDYTFQLKKTNKDGLLLPHERMLVNWFFGKEGRAGKVSLSMIREQAEHKKSAEAFYDKWTKWQDEVLHTVNRLNYFEERPKNSKIYAWFVIVVALQVFAVWWLTGGSFLVLYPLPLLLFRMKSQFRTPSGQTEYAKWKSFKRFLNDYSRMASREPLAVHLWEQYFVYAISLGVAKKMEAIGHIHLPGMNQEDSVLANTIYYRQLDHWATSFDKTISEGRPASSSGDSGGTFSSGGGGGGGGGGRGAF